MEVDSIENLKVIRNTLKASVKTIRVREFEDRTFGSESEYDARSVMASVDSIITDVGGLLRAPRRFLQGSSYSDRELLTKHLKSLNAYLEDEDLGSTCNIVETLKPILRSYGIRHNEERFDEFIDRTNELQKKVQALTELLGESKKAHTEILDITSTAQSLKEKIEGQNKILNERQTVLDNLITQSEEARNGVINLNSSSKCDTFHFKQPSTFL